MDWGIGFAVAIVVLFAMGPTKPGAGIFAGLVGLGVKYVIGTVRANTKAAAEASSVQATEDRDRLRTEIDALKTRCKSDPSEHNAGNLFALGCMYAELFDHTTSDAHRDSALKYMSRAAELDPAVAKVDSDFGGSEASSLFEEPEFQRFIR